MAKRASAWARGSEASEQMLCTRPPVPSTKEQTGDAGRSSERLARLFGSSTNRTLPNSPLEAGEAPRGLRTATTSTSSPATASATRASARNSASHRSSLSMKATTAPTRSLSHGSRSSCANLHPQSSDGFFRASGAESERDKGRRLAASSAQTRGVETRRRRRATAQAKQPLQLAFLGGVFVA